jgi:hypothetical protein
VTSPKRRLSVAMRAARSELAGSFASRVATNAQRAAVLNAVPPPAVARSFIMRASR